MSDLSIIQKTYDLVKWYVPVLSRFSRDHKFGLGDRITTQLYELLEGLLLVQYEKNRIPQLKQLNAKLNVIRYQTRLAHDFDLMDIKRYEFVSRLINEIGLELGGWIKQQRSRPEPQAAEV
jgi:23S rRNA-intervening sequence protein